jgi:hypothetical protein
MPPRFAYWTILIDQKPTAFRAREQADLLPTLHQLRRKNTDVVMKWFARGRLWDSPAEAQSAWRAPKKAPEKRGREWRPGGGHEDPRRRFKKESRFRRQATGGGQPAGKGARKPPSPKRG